MPSKHFQAQSKAAQEYFSTTATAVSAGEGQQFERTGEVY